MDEGQTEGASEGWDFSNIYNRGFFSKSKAGPAPAALSPCLILTAQQTALSPKALEDMHRLSNSSKQLLNAMECSDFEATMALSLEQLAESGGAGSEIEVSTAVSNILKNHKSQHAPSTLRRTGNMALAYGLHQSQTTNIRRLFQSVDIDGSGALCTAEFTRAMILLCGPDALTEDDCSMIFKQMDINRDDQISFTEFLAGTLNPEALDIEELSKAFALLDHNGDGFISADELKKLYNFKFMKKQYPTQETASLEPMCPPTTADGAADVDPPKNCPKISRVHSNDITDEMTPQPKISRAATLDETVMQIMKQCDTDQDGRISYEEFIMAMTGGHEMLDWACVPLQGQEGDPDDSVGPHEDGMGEEEIEEEVGEESAGGRTGQVEPGAPTTLNGDCSGDAAKRPQSVHGDDSRSNSVSSTIKRGLMGIFTRSGSNSRVVPHNSDSANPAQEKGPGPAADQEFSEVLSTAHAACTVESKMCDDQETGEAPGLVAGEGR
jgi:Ca2+-binding EF-hand superfamily protein